MWASMQNTLLTRQYFAQNPKQLDAANNADPAAGAASAGASMSMSAGMSGMAGMSMTAGAAAVPTATPDPVAAAASAPTQSAGGAKTVREHEGWVIAALGIMAFLAVA